MNEQERTEAYHRGACLDRYFTNEPGQPQRMHTCTLTRGHHGLCGQKGATK